MKDISKIISIVFLSFSILLLCYVFYRSQILYAGIRFDYYFKHYVIAFLFIIFSFISFFIPKKLKINITIVFVSILVGLYIVEGYLTVKNQGIDNKFEIYKNRTGKDYDKRSKIQIYQDLKKENPNIVVSIYPKQLINHKNLDYFPLSGLPNRKTIYCNENGYYPIYQSDRYGFNNPDEEWDKGEIDYLLVGDSFTQGHCVNEPDTISGNLRKLTSNKPGILNLGQNGNGSLMEYATLREYLPSKKVKRILWLYYYNDLEDIKVELNNQILASYLKDENFTQDLILKKQELEKILLREMDVELEYGLIMDEAGSTQQGRFTKLIKFVRLDLTRDLKFSNPTPKAISIKEFRNILKLSHEFTEQNNSKLYFVYLPDYAELANKYDPDTLSRYKEIIKVVKNLNISIIDINKELSEKHEDLISLYSFISPTTPGHYNELGYQLIAKIIFKKIMELEK